MLTEFMQKSTYEDINNLSGLQKSILVSFAKDDKTTPIELSRKLRKDHPSVYRAISTLQQKNLLLTKKDNYLPTGIGFIIALSEGSDPQGVKCRIDSLINRGVLDRQNETVRAVLSTIYMMRQFPAGLRNIFAKTFRFDQDFLASVGVDLDRLDQFVIDSEMPIISFDSEKSKQFWDKIKSDESPIE